MRTLTMLPSGGPVIPKRPAPMIWALLFLSCSTEPINTPLPDERATSPDPSPTIQLDSAALASRAQNPPTGTEQISQYIRRIFQDRDGDMWFGTTSDGAVRYDPSAALGGSGQTLTYFNSTSGLGSDWVSSIVQDAQGHIWFGTRDGIARYDGQRFSRFTTKDGLADDHVHCLLFDRKGVLWAATEQGVSRFDGRTFISFPIPVADLSKFPYQEGPKRINWMVEDKAGHIWFASNGGGVYRYDEQTLTNYSEKEGLCNNFVQTMLEDRTGNLWFGTRYGGVCEYHPSVDLKAGGNSFTSYGRKELSGDDVSSLYQDSNGTIWIGVTRVGLCSYDGKAFSCYNEKDGPGIRVIFNALEDTEGQLWFGTGEGIYRLVGGAFANWTKEDALDPRPR